MPPQNPTPTHHIQTAENRTESKQLERIGKYTIPTRRKDKNYMCSDVLEGPGLPIEALTAQGVIMYFP